MLDDIMAEISLIADEYESIEVQREALFAAYRDANARMSKLFERVLDNISLRSVRWILDSYGDLYRLSADHPIPEIQHAFIHTGGAARPSGITHDSYSVEWSTYKKEVYFLFHTPDTLIKFVKMNAITVIASDAIMERLKSVTQEYDRLSFIHSAVCKGE